MEQYLDKKLDLVEKIVEKNPHADILTLLKEKPVHKNRFTISKNYIMSTFLFPYGLFLFFKLYFIEEEKFEALICLAITVLIAFSVFQEANYLFSTVNHIGTSQLTPLTPQGF